MEQAPRGVGDRYFRARRGPTVTDSSTLTREEGVELRKRYRDYIEVEFPSPKTDGKWELTPGGWVGHLPVSRSLLLHLSPKVPVANIFRMWDYAYRLRGFHFLEQLVGLSSVEEYFEQLAIR